MMRASHQGDLIQMKGVKGKSGMKKPVTTASSSLVKGKRVIAADWPGSTKPEGDSDGPSALTSGDNHARPGTSTGAVATGISVTPSTSRQQNRGQGSTEQNRAVKAPGLPEGSSEGNEEDVTSARETASDKGLSPLTGVGQVEASALETNRTAQPTVQSDQTVTALNNANIVELARPFVAMICEEFAKALVNAASEKGVEQALRHIVKSALVQSPGYLKASASVHQSKEGKDQSVHNKSRPVQGLLASAEQSAQVKETEHFDEAGGHPAEAQPLFDPKLPPSAQSEFKPTIGLVGPSANLVDELRQRYPQFQLIVVPVDAVRSGNVFRQCQRIIGLNDEIPPPTDEFLLRSLKHRYVRLAGGMERVKEQLDHWLGKPGSISGGPRGPRGPLQSNRNRKSGTKHRDGSYNKRTTKNS
jgi:hypothetical protein